MAVFSELRGNQRAEDSLSGGLVCNASRLGTLGWQQVAHVVLRLASLKTSLGRSNVRTPSKYSSHDAIFVFLIAPSTTTPIEGPVFAVGAFGKPLLEIEI